MVGTRGHYYDIYRYTNGGKTVKLHITLPRNGKLEYVFGRFLCIYVFGAEVVPQIHKYIENVVSHIQHIICQNITWIYCSIALVGLHFFYWRPVLSIIPIARLILGIPSHINMKIYILKMNHIELMINSILWSIDWNITIKHSKYNRATVRNTNGIYLKKNKQEYTFILCENIVLGPHYIFCVLSTYIIIYTFDLVR